MSILDLPLERQKAIAQQMGMDHAAWVKEIKQNLKDADKFLDEVREVEAKGGNMTPEERERFQRKMDSANPV